MKPINVVQSASAHQDSTSVGQLCSIKHQVWKIPTLAGLTFLSATIALLGLGIHADQTLAQSRHYWRRGSYPAARRSTPPDRSGVVSTNSGIGLNIRSGPGLHFPIIGGAPDGAFLELTGRPVFANCYTWRRVTTGGWVATEYVAGNFGGCRPGSVSPPVGIAPPVPPAIGWRGGPYVVVVPPTGGNVPNQLSWVRQFVPGAFRDAALPGEFINAGSFRDYDAAQSQSYFLRSQGFDARVYFAYR
ncbi:hypothetical protein [Leptodesmis sp.]|uniref:hypothetical protein n=1 Tax=Leptodesmis sp. TaxID=3100501 RepID=UPI0040535033